MKALLGAFYQEKALVEGLLHDYEIFANLRSKLYNQNCCLGFCVEILWRAQRPGAAVRDLSVLLSDIPLASLASRCLSVVGLIIINLFYFGSYGSILWMSRKSHTNMALIKYKYKFSPPQGAVQRVGRLPAAADNCTNAQEQRRHFNSVFCISAELSWVQLQIPSVFTITVKASSRGLLCDCENRSLTAVPRTTRQKDKKLN